MVAVMGLCALTLAPRPSFAATDVAFVGLEAGAGVDEKEATSISDFFQAELSRASGWRLMGPKDVSALLDVEARKQLAGCADDTSCIADIAGALGTERVITGSVSRIGNSILLVVNLLDATEARAIHRVNERVKTEDSLEPVLDRLASVAGELVAAARAADRLAGKDADETSGDAATDVTTEGEPPKNGMKPEGEEEDSIFGYRLDLRFEAGPQSGGNGEADFFTPALLMRLSWAELAVMLALSRNYNPLRKASFRAATIRFDLRFAFAQPNWGRFYYLLGAAVGNGFGWRTGLGFDWLLWDRDGWDLIIPIELALEEYGIAVGAPFERGAVILAIGFGFDF